MINDLKTKLSESTLSDLEEFEKTGEDSIWNIVNKPENFSTEKIITRFQTANIESVFDSGLKTQEEWTGVFYGPKEIKETLSPLTTMNKFSSYALMEDVNRLGKIRYPMFDTLAAKTSTFIKKDFDTYAVLKQKISQAYNIKIIESAKYPLMFKYKRNKIRFILKKFKDKTFNLCRKIFRKPLKSYRTNAFRGTMYINDKLIMTNGKTHVFSEQEKIVKVLDSIVDLTAKRYVVKAKYTIDENELFVSRLIANVLISRAIDYGDIENNKKVEACLSLQLSNVLARLDIDSERMKIISDIATTSAAHVIKNLGIGIDSVKDSMINSGYQYSTQPLTIKEALTPKAKILEKIISDSKELSTKKEEFDELRKKAEDAIGDAKIISEKIGKTPEDEIDYGPIVSENKEDSEHKFNGVKKLSGAKTPEIKRDKAEKYIDSVIASKFKKEIDKSYVEIYASESLNPAKQTAGRKYNFFEHAASFYDTNKDKDNTEQIKNELSANNVADNNIAHAFANAFVKFKNFVIDSIFNKNASIEKPEGKELATIVNDFVSQRYGKSLATFVSSKLKTETKQVFKKADSKQLTDISFIEEKK